MANRACKILVIGGGAAGLAAAIAAGDRARATGTPADVTVLERDERVGRSILATGNGRCNFSNREIRPGAYYNADFAEEALGALAARNGEGTVLRFLEGCGLAWRSEADGRLYPAANKASSVVDVLRAALKQSGGREACDRRVASVEPPRAPGKPFTLRMEDNVLERADAVIVACGGRALANLELEGLDVLRQRPVLGPVKCTPEGTAVTRELDNIRVRCTVELARRQGGDLRAVAAETGELMFRKYGVSGICVFNLSRFAWPGDVLHIDFLQKGSAQAAAQFLENRRAAIAPRFGDGMTHGDLLRGLLLPRVSEALLKVAGLHPDDPFEPADAARLAELLAGFPLEVAGIADPDLCQVRRGGVAVDAVDPATCMAVDVPGLFPVGEALDVDGPCGGYNLHWAWATGLLAGAAAVDWLNR